MSTEPSIPHPLIEQLKADYLDGDKEASAKAGRILNYIADLEAKVRAHPTPKRGYCFNEHIGKPRCDGTSEIRSPDSSLSEIAGLLEPIAEQDWHGKWRIQKAITVARQHQADHPEDKLNMVKPREIPVASGDTAERIIGRLLRAASSYYVSFGMDVATKKQEEILENAKQDAIAFVRQAERDTVIHHDAKDSAFPSVFGSEISVMAGGGVAPTAHSGQVGNPPPVDSLGLSSAERVAHDLRVLAGDCIDGEPISRDAIHSLCMRASAAILATREPVLSKHWSDCRANGYDTDEGIKYAPEAECDCGGYAEDAPTGNAGDLQDVSSVQSSTSSAPNKQPDDNTIIGILRDELTESCFADPYNCDDGARKLFDQLRPFLAQPMRESGAEVHFSSLTRNDFATINAAIEISKPAASDLESLNKLQMKLLMLARLANTHVEGQS